MNQQVVGHDAVRLRFTEAMGQQRLHHAWLLYGVQGIGKAALAQDFAALFLCQQPGNQQQACGSCHACTMLSVGTHPDFKRVERLFDTKKKKFNRDISIEQTRDALSFLALSGLRSQKRVLLIDDANLMNNQAANALLKSLEEPTPGNLLLIVCHDLNRLPATIRSRCMLQACAPLNDGQMADILTQQQLPEHLHPLAISLGQGSLGRVAALHEAGHAKALQEWQSIVSNLERSDIGMLQQWLDKYVKIIPHDLIVSMV
ncbi:MAG: DNA polymerase III subunit delta', partial [Ghiorsea sp.]